MLQSRSFIALLVLAGFAMTAPAQDTLDLKWKFEKGKVFYQEVTTKTEQKIKVMGMDVAQNQEQTFIFSWTPEKQDDKDKSWVVKQKIEGLKMNIDIGGQKITYDSTKETNTANPLSDFFKALVGAEFTLTISADGRVTDIKGKDEFVKKLVQVNPQMEPLLKQILSDDALKQMADPAFAVVPDKPKKKGESWERKSTLNIGPIGSYDNTYKYTLEGTDEKDKNLAKIKVQTTLKYIPPVDTATQQLPFKVKNAKLETKDATGEVIFDIAKGRVVSSKMSQNLSGTLSIDVGGMTTDVELTQSQTTTVKTTEENPIKKPA